MRRGFLIEQKPTEKKRRQLRSDLSGYINQSNLLGNALMFGQNRAKNGTKNETKNGTQNDEKNTSKQDTEFAAPDQTITYFDLLPLNVKQILMQWIWYTQPKINWMGDGRDESIRLTRMLRLQRIANEILKINNVRIYGDKSQ